jgi:hypothetical protein
VLKANGYYPYGFTLEADGRFEITGVLPGTYELEIKAFAHDSISRTIDVDDHDVTIDFVIRSIR